MFLACWFLAYAFYSQAELTITIDGGAAQQIPIAVVPFSQPAGLPASLNTALAQQETLAAVISSDLRRSGMFRVLETRGVISQPHEIG